LLPTWRPVVAISSPSDDNDEDEGCDAISTHDSAIVSGGDADWLRMLTGD